MKPRPNGRAHYKFRLYVAGDAQNSTEAIANLTALCQDVLKDHYAIEVVDVFLNPKRALADHILMTPTLVKLEPSPSARIVGTLSKTESVMKALGLKTAAM